VGSIFLSNPQDTLLSITDNILEIIRYIVGFNSSTNWMAAQKKG